MTVEEFRAAGVALFNHGWQTKLAGRLGVNSRTVRRWANGETEIPEWVEIALSGVGKPVETQLPEWIFGDDISCQHEYVMHTCHPRFVARITNDDELMSGISFIDEPDQIGELVWMDMPQSQDVEREWLERAANALEEYNQASSAIAEAAQRT